MNRDDFRQSAGGPDRQLPAANQPGDLVVPRAGYPTLCEVIAVEGCGLLRIRGLDWETGYSSVVLASDYVPASRILVDGRASSAPSLPQFHSSHRSRPAMAKRQRPRQPEPAE